MVASYHWEPLPFYCIRWFFLQNPLLLVTFEPFIRWQWQLWNQRWLKWRKCKRAPNDSRKTEGKMILCKMKSSSKDSLVLHNVSDVVSEFWRGMSDDTLSPLLISEAMRARGGLEDRAKGWAATSSALGLNNPPWQVYRDSTKVWTKKSIPTHFPLVSRLNLLATPAGLGGFSAFGVPSLS